MRTWMMHIIDFGESLIVGILTHSGASFRTDGNGILPGLGFTPRGFVYITSYSS